MEFKRCRSPDGFIRKALKLASFGKIGVLLIPLSVTSACREASPTSIHRIEIGHANSPPAAILPKEKIVLRDVFKCDSSRIRPASEPILDEAIELLKNQPDMKVYVDSSCDSTRENQLNPRLSQQRATAVTTYLQRHGIAANRLISRGFDATHFVARNTASGRLQNHRGKLGADLSGSTTSEPEEPRVVKDLPVPQNKRILAEITRWTSYETV